MNIVIISAIIAATGIASSVVTFKIWEKESFKNYDLYDKALRDSMKRIRRLMKENSKLQAQVAEFTYRTNPAQADFYSMPTKKDYNKKSDLFGEW